MDRRAPGALEAEVLAVLWATAEPQTPAQVRDHLVDELAYTTVSTILRRLHDKGLVVRSLSESGRAHAYAPSLDHAEHAAAQMHALLAKSGDREQVLARFLGRLPADDRVVVRRLLRGSRANR